MNARSPWIRSIVALPLGLVAIHLFHMAGATLLPQAYGALDNDPVRWLALLLVVSAGSVGSAVVGIVAGHRLALHMLVFLLIMLVIDIGIITGELATQPVWFKSLVIATLPLQVGMGGWLARRVAGHARPAART